MYFPEAQRRILDHLAGARSITKLMIEAPLSVSFRNGRPAPRSVERRDGKNRFWYVGAGCAVMVASMYLLKAIDSASPPCGVRLFEALISYKDQEARSGPYEAELLRDAVRDRKRHPVQIVPADHLKEQSTDERALSARFGVIGLDCGVPSVVML